MYIKYEERNVTEKNLFPYRLLRWLTCVFQVRFLPCQMQFKQKITKQIISLSIVSIAFDTVEMRRMNRASVL